MDSGKERRHSETILLVEDEEAVRKLLRRILEKAGYTILDARDGVEALSVSAAHQEPIQLLVTDVVMPEMSGPALADRITALRPGNQSPLCLRLHGQRDPPPKRAESRKAFPLEAFFGAGVLQKVREVLDSPGPA